MRLHLPVRLFKSVLVCLTAVASFSLGSGVAWAEAQNLTFSGSSLTWDTSAENKSFVDEEDAAASFAAGDNVSFTGESTVTLGENITAGTLDIAAGADVTIDLGNYTLNADAISLSGTLNVGDSLSIASGSTLAVQNDTAVLDSALVLGEKSGLVVESAASLNNNTLILQGGSNLILTAAGDGKTYTLFTGISGLLGADGSAFELTEENNAIANYFDTTRPGTGFWAGATLMLNNGTLQLVRHNETVKEAVTITTRQTNGADYQYYAGVSFENITNSSSESSVNGGAIAGNTITLNNNGSVTFSGNSASGSGGAIVGNTITLNNNGSVAFSGNSDHVFGGAIYGINIELNYNGSVEFSGNSGFRTGAIAGHEYCTITLNHNGSVCFSGNTASSYAGAVGGEVCIVTLSNNASVSFIENTAYCGGAIFGGNIELNNNGSVLFSGNTALSSTTDYPTSLYGGGAICMCYGNMDPTTLNDNGSVTFSGNSTFYYGGAIRIFGSLHIRNNDSVLFEKNVEVMNGTYRLRSIYADGGSGAVISLSAAAGKSIEFRDSVYIYSGSTVNLNADYTDAEGVIHKQAGDIILTGAYTEVHLNELLAADGAERTATEEEILNSRTTEVNALTNLYGGRLRVEDGAIYQGQGIMVHEGSGVTVRVKDATLSHSGYDLTFNAGTTLELVGDSKLAGNLMMLSGSILSLDSTMNLNGSLTLGNEVVLGGALLDDILSMKAGDTLTLVSGLESLRLQTQSLIRSLEYITLLSGDLVNASDYFVNLKGYSDLVFSYDSNTQTLNMIYAIPEPTTTTLSLLALAALAARRRRK